MATKKPTPAQLAARERFAAMARSGAFKRKPAAKRARNPVPAKRGKGDEYMIRVLPKAGTRFMGGWVAVPGRSRDPRDWSYDSFPGAQVFDVSKAAALKSCCDAHGYTCEVHEVRDANPLTRVKRNSPSMATGEAPSARLKKRRAKTAKAPAGYYANPAPGKLWTVYTTDAQGNPRTDIAHFRKMADAKQYARAYADLHRVAVVIKGKDL